MSKIIDFDILEHNLDEINGGARDFLNNKSEEAVVNFALMIFKRIEERAIYNKFLAKIESDKTAVYFLARLRAEIRPYVFRALNRENLYIPKRHIFNLLRDAFVLHGIHFDDGSMQSRFIESLSLLFREFIRRIRLRIANKWNRLLSDGTLEGASGTEPVIAVHLSEGIDANKRSDIHWFPQSLIDVDRILILINENSIEKKYGLFAVPVKRIINELKGSPFKWVFVPQALPAFRHSGTWAPPEIRLPEWTKSLAEDIADGLDRWIYNTYLELLAEVDFWKTFFKTFNVKILYFPGEGSATLIARGIAFDISGEKSGFMAGKQRSDIGQSAKMLTGYHTKDVVFTWNGRNPEYFRLPYNIVRAQISAGHPNGSNFSQSSTEVKSAEKQFAKNKVKFVVTLFDTGHGDPFYYNFASAEMERIYSLFLNWVLEDEDVGLLIKSKKPYILNNLPDILPLFDKAEQTGRCVQLPFKCLPSQVSRISDMVVGLAISTAMSEAVIAGCKGIHYHNKFPKGHEYYRLGYEKLVFDDLDRMMDALKGYKADRNSDPRLGDWTPYLDLMDSFRDGRAGERMGMYFRWSLEGFDAGMGREQVIKQANNKYVARWGADKIIKTADKSAAS